MSTDTFPAGDIDTQDDDFDPFAGGAAELERVVNTSEAQREVWLADKLSPQASLAYNESMSLRLTGPLDVSALQAALQTLVRRHALLRATVSPEGTQLLVNADAVMGLPLNDLRGQDAAAQRVALQRAADSEVETPFDLEHGPLFRASLCRLSDAEHVLLLSAHHIVCDGWSWGLIGEDLGALYTEQLGAGPGLAAANDYADYLAWEASESSGPALQAHERFWLGRFAGSSLPVLDLPTDRARAPQRSFNARRLDLVLDTALVSDVRQLGARIGVSLFAALFSGFAATLHRLTGQDDLVIGVPSAGQSASGLTQLVGHCVNLLPVRTAVDPLQSFEALTRQTGSALLDAFDHQAMTYGALLSRLPVQRDASRLPLVSVMFNVDQAVSSPRDSFVNLRADLSSNPRHYENFELFINASQRDDGGLRLECQYNTDLFDAVSIERWLRSYRALLASAVRDAAQTVGAISWLAPQDLAAVQALQPALAPVIGSDLMHTAIQRQCAATPARAAVQCGGDSLSYAELDQRANRLARALRARGVQRGERVGLCLSRGTEMLVAMLAVLKAGGSYIPLDPGFPPARLAYYAEDAHLALLLTESGLSVAPTAWRSDAAQRVLVLNADLGWLQESAEALPAGPGDAQPEDAAYIIYTSGSTGKPKGVAVPHRAVANFLATMAQQPGIAAADRLAAVTTLSFDIAVLELLLPLTVGAEVVIVPRETAMDGNLLRELLARTGASMMQATPGMWRMLLEAGWQGGSGFKVLVGGESLPPDLARDLLDASGEVWNMYGPTETTVWSTVWRVEREALSLHGVSIGRPIANTTVWTLDAAGQPSPIGVPGEMCIGGHGVAVGYLDRPELTADRFVPDPYSPLPGARLYRTGDRGRWRNDGLLEHMGRLDFQVKVRGYRIELGEIEAGCSDWPGVSQCVVLAREDHPGDVRLVAYLSLVAGAALDEAGLRAHLRARMPDYMLPQHTVVLGALPRLPNGKIDRKALPAPVVQAATSAAERVAPRNALERTVVTAMESVLKLPGLGVHDDFFALGGHSLLAARLTSALNRDLGLSLPLRTLFEAPTAETLAVAIEKAQASNIPRRKPLPYNPARRFAPLTPAQERIRFIKELYPDDVVYNTPSAHRLLGDMNLPAFQRAFTALLQRQPALRTCIMPAAGGGYEQHVVDDPIAPIPLVDLSDLAPELREQRMLSEIQVAATRPMNLYKIPLFSAVMYRMSPTDHVLMFAAHHIVWDGWSFDVFYADIAALYAAELAGTAADLPPLTTSLGDYAEWFNDWLQGAEAAAQLDFWKHRFATVQTPQPMATDLPRTPGMIGEGHWVMFELGEGLTRRLRAKARAHDLTLNMLTMSVFVAMLGRLSGSPHLILGVPVRGRQMSELESVVGFFNNLLPIPFVVEPEAPLGQALRTLKQELLQAMSNQEIPFELLSALPEIASKASSAGLYQASFGFQDVRDRCKQWGNLSHSRVPLFQNGVTEELNLALVELPKRVTGSVSYNVKVYTETTAQALTDWYLELLNRVADTEGLTVGQLTDPQGSAPAAHLLALAERAQLQAASVSALPPVVSERPVGATPLAGREAELAQVWAQLLGIAASDMRASDNFFDLGGDSMLAMRAVEAAVVAMGVRVDGRRYIYESLGQIAATPASNPSPEDGAPVGAPQRPGLLGRLFSTMGRRKPS